MTIATLFSGFGGADAGARAAGLELAWGLELDPAIAEVARANLGHAIHVGDILACDPRRFEAVDVLHASPPCPSFSVASQGKETALDIALSRKVAEFVTVLCPRVVTLENVGAYRHSKSWRIVEDALHAAGYWVNVEHCNAADYAVPQTRKRMIVRAIRGGFVPYLPEPKPWVGWYAAIEDLLDTLPESQFAPWQLARLDPALLQTTLVAQSGFEGGIGMTAADAPSPTVTANHNQIGIKAFLMQVQGEGGDGVRYADEPMQTVASNHAAAKYRAWLVDGANTTEGQLSLRGDSQPALTVTTGGPKHPTRALLEQGRVVAMTPRALARFQSFADSYQLPDNARLAAKGIGNAVPPLMMQRIYEQLLEVMP
jgi:DNA (cytosine-5)-methyltransferase 1